MSQINLKWQKNFTKRTLEIDKKSEWAKLNLSILEQTSGNYFKGLSLYEDRDKERCLLLHKNYKENHLQEVTDLKQINENNKILIIGEQGFGDQLMICHYLSRLSLLGYRITYLVNEKLYNVIRNIKELKNIKIIKNVNENELNLYSYKIYSMSLPFFFINQKLKENR